MPKVLKITLHFFAVFPEKSIGYEIDLQINKNVFYKLIASLWVSIVRHAQSTKNNNFIISLQYLRGNVKGFSCS